MIGRIFRRRLGLFGLTLALSTASAQVIWNGGGGDNNWSTPANWSGTAAPSSDGTATVQFAGSTRVTPSTDTPWIVAGVAFNAGASAFTVSGSALTIGSGGIANNSSTQQTINNNLSISGNTTFDATGRSLILNGTISGNGGFNAVSTGSNIYLAAPSPSPRRMPSWRDRWHSVWQFGGGGWRRSPAHRRWPEITCEAPEHPPEVRIARFDWAIRFTP